MLVAKELEEARLLGHQYRETSWTDRMLFELKRLRDPRVVTVTSNERVTGADMDWWFVRRGSSVNFCLTIQTKILHYKQADARLWHYEDIAHPTNAPGLQSRILVRYARKMQRAGTPAYPYYFFYNPEAIGSSRSFNWLPSDGGITIIDGFVAASHIAQHIGAENFPITAKRHAALQPMMASLTDLLCRSFNGVPDPEEIADRVESLRNRVGRRMELPRTVRRVKPALGKQLPSHIREIVARSARSPGSDDSPLEEAVVRNTVVFIAD